jgi:hypothetical protein
MRTAIQRGEGRSLPKKASARHQLSLDGLRWKGVGTVAGDVRSFNATGLAAATTYYYRIHAFNSGGSAGYTTPVQATMTK